MPTLKYIRLEWQAARNGGDNITKIRPARSRFEVDALPPFGRPEVVVFGPAAMAAGLLVAIVVVLRYLE